MNDLKAGYTFVDEDYKNARMRQRIPLKCVLHVPKRLVQFQLFEKLTRAN